MRMFFFQRRSLITFQISQGLRWPTETVMIVVDAPSTHVTVSGGSPADRHISGAQAGRGRMLIGAPEPVSNTVPDQRHRASPCTRFVRGGTAKRTTSRMGCESAVIRWPTRFRVIPLTRRQTDGNHGPFECHPCAAGQWGCPQDAAHSHGTLGSAKRTMAGSSPGCSVRCPVASRPSRTGSSPMR